MYVKIGVCVIVEAFSVVELSSTLRLCILSSQRVGVKVAIKPKKVILAMLGSLFLCLLFFSTSSLYRF